MPRCMECGARWRELEDEHGDHPCPGCGRGPDADRRQERALEDLTTDQLRAYCDDQAVFGSDPGKGGEQELYRLALIMLVKAWHGQRDVWVSREDMPSLYDD